MQAAHQTPTDPIPPSLKTHFYKTIDPPNLSKDFDAIGFDADHCFVKYKVKELLKLLVNIKLKDMHEYSVYPEEIMTSFDVETDDLQICLNYAVIDVNRGNILKMGEGGRVLVAIKGRQRLSEQELEEQYGAGVPKFDYIEWPNLTKLNGEEGEARYATCPTFFEVCKCALFAMGVEMIQKGLVEKTFDQLLNDIKCAIERNYYHIGKEG